MPAIQGFIDLLTGIWDLVRPVLEAFRDGVEAIIGVVVGTMVIAMYLPIFKMAAVI